MKGIVKSCQGILGLILLLLPPPFAMAQSRTTIPTWLSGKPEKKSSNSSSSSTSSSENKLDSKSIFLLPNGQATTVLPRDDKAPNFTVLPNGQVVATPSEDNKSLDPNQSFEELEQGIKVREAKRGFSGNGSLVAFRYSSWANFESESNFLPKDNLLHLGFNFGNAFQCEKPLAFSLQIRPENFAAGGKAPVFSMALERCQLNFDRVTVLHLLKDYAQALEFCQNAEPTCDFIWVDNGLDGRFGPPQNGSTYRDDIFIVGKIIVVTPQQLQNTNLSSVSQQVLAANPPENANSASPADGVGSCVSSKSGDGKRVYLNENSMEHLANAYCQNLAPRQSSHLNDASCQSAISACTALTKGPLFQEFKDTSGPAPGYGCEIQHGGSATHPIEDLVCCPNAIYNSVVYKIFGSAFLPSLDSLRDLIEQDCR